MIGVIDRMNKPIQRVGLVLLLAVALMSCAHQKATKRADKYMQQGRYELALKSYQQALHLKPNNQETQASVQSAQNHFDRWLDELQVAADRTTPSFSGKAMILYAKLVNERRSPANVRRYRTLLSEIVDKQQLPLALDYNSGVLGSNLGENIKGLALISINAPKVNSKPVVRFSLGQATSRINQNSIYRSESYLSGVETIPNPEFIGIQTQVQDLLADKDEDQSDYQRYQTLVNKQSIERNKLSREARRLNAQLNNLDQSSLAYQQINSHLNSVKNALNNIDIQLENTYEARDEASRRYHSHTENLADFQEKIAYTAPTVLQEVYSNYAYPVNVLTKIMSAELTVTINTGREYLLVKVDYVDDEFDDHPIINLAAKQASFPSDEQLQLELYSQARLTANQYLKELVKQHRNSLLGRANRSIAPAQQFELWIAYLLAGDQTDNHDIVQKIQRHLKLEFGNAGEFNISDLINLYN